MSNILTDIYNALTTLEIPAQIGDYQTTSPLPDVYAVILPIVETLETADDAPDIDVQQASVELYTRGMWRAVAKSICDKCIETGLIVYARRYIERNEETGFFHYSITFEGSYPYETLT